MAQTRFLEYKQIVDSFKANIKYLGILEPGRYRGFDTLIPTGPLTFQLSHILTGITQANINLNLPTPKVGVIITKQGVIIQEDTDVPVVALSIDHNIGNAAKRSDLVVLEYEYIESVGGSTAIYSIIKGQMGFNNPPALTNPQTQIIIGILEIPAGADNLTGVIWKKSSVPSLGNDSIAKLKEGNLFEKPMGFNQGTSQLEVDDTGDVILRLYDDGSYFRVNIGYQINEDPNIGTALFDNNYNPWKPIASILTSGTFPEGALIWVEFSHLPGTKKVIKFRNQKNISGTLFLNSWLPALETMDITDGSILQFRKQSTSWILQDIKFGNNLPTSYFLSSTKNIEESIVQLDRELKFNFPKEIIENLLGIPYTDQFVILSGGVFSGNVPGTSSLTAGTAFADGKIFHWDDAFNVITTGTQQLNFHGNYPVEGKANIIPGEPGDGLSFNNPKVIYLKNYLPHTNKVAIRTEVIPIGDWDMTNVLVITIAHGLGDKMLKAKSIDVMILRDGGLTIHPLNAPLEGTTEIMGGWLGANNNSITLYRADSSMFNTTSFNSTSFNRGWVTVQYVD